MRQDSQRQAERAVLGFAELGRSQPGQVGQLEVDIASEEASGAGTKIHLCAP